MAAFEALKDAVALRGDGARSNLFFGEALFMCGSPFGHVTQAGMRIAYSTSSACNGRLKKRAYVTGSTLVRSKTTAV